MVSRLCDSLDIHRIGSALVEGETRDYRMPVCGVRINIRTAIALENLDHYGCSDWNRPWVRVHYLLEGRRIELIWELMVLCGFFTFATRYSMISGFAPKELPRNMEHSLRFVPIAVLTAILVPEVIFAESGNMSFQGNFRLLAAGIAVIVAQTTRSVIATICFGMLSLWLLEWVY